MFDSLLKASEALASKNVELTLKYCNIAGLIALMTLES
jgi:hypothetical protein